MSAGPAFLVWNEECFQADSVLGLIEGIYFAEPERARKILRSRIYVSHEPSIAEKELVRVAAKRWAFYEPPFPAVTRFFTPPPLEASPALPAGMAYGSLLETESDARRLLETLLSQTRHAESRSASDRAVATILLDRDRKLLAAELNTNGTVRTRHAEMNLLLRVGKIPKGATLVVSLKPCAMCAAGIWEAAEDVRELQVLYLEDDPGKFGKNTILTLGSPARQRFLGPPHPLFLADIERIFP